MEGLIVGIIVLLALVYFIRKIRNATMSKGCCGCGCSGCSRAPKGGASSCCSTKHG